MDTLLCNIFEQLSTHQISVATAESITGGLVAARLVSIPGISRYYTGSIIAYSNAVKTALLDVSPQSLARFGAVSKVVASEMATGGRARLNAQLCVSTTGIAGPTGGTPPKPLGLVYIGVSDGVRINVEREIFPGDRKTVRQSATESALAVLQQFIGAYY